MFNAACKFFSFPKKKIIEIGLLYEAWVNISSCKACLKKKNRSLASHIIYINIMSMPLDACCVRLLISMLLWSQGGGVRTLPSLREH